MKLRKNRFTLVELLVVIAIITILAGMAIGVMGLATQKMANSKTQALIQKISVALENYKAKYGYYIQRTTAGIFYLDVVNSAASATASDNIKNNFCQFVDYDTLISRDTATYGGRYWLVDGYGNPLIYRSPGYFNKGGFDLGSVGSDGKYGDGGTALTLSNAETDFKANQTGSNALKNFGNGDDLTNFKR